MPVRTWTTLLHSVIFETVIDSKPWLNSFLNGLLLTGGAIALSSAVAFWGFDNSYYLGVLLPVFMVFYALLAWLIHLKRTDSLALFSLPRKSAIRHHENGLTGDLPEEKAAGTEISDLRDENGLVRRKKAPEDPEGGAERGSRVAVAALMWSALQIAVLATALYKFLGVGTRYF